MKIIQTFIAEPLYNSPYAYKMKHLEFGFGGFSNRFDFYSTWITSFNSIKKYYPDVKLYCDELGFNILIEKLELKYDDYIILEPPYYAKYSDSIWAANKILVYSLQDEPFIHFDGDLILKRPLSNEILNSEIVFEFPHKKVEQKFFKLLTDVNKAVGINEELKSKIPFFDKENHDKPLMYNFGIFGGKAFIEIQKISKIALELSEFIWNSDTMPNTNLINPLIEQFVMTQLIYKNDLEINSVINLQLDRERFFDFFLKKGFDLSHIHLLSYNKVHFSKYINSTLFEENQIMYKKLSSLCKNGEI